MYPTKYVPDAPSRLPALQALREAAPPRSAPGAAARCAESLSLRALAHGAALALSLLSLGSCGGEPTGASGIDPAVAVARLVDLCTPLDPTLTSDHHDRQLRERRAQVARLKAGGREVGLEALRVYRQRAHEDNPLMVRLRTLEVGAHAAPQDARPLLEKLILEYGHPMDVRTESLRLLAETAPLRAVELIGPMVRVKRKSQTVPEDEFLLRGYVTACEGAGTSPVNVLVDVATNIFKQDAARHFAAQALGDHGDEPLAIKALETLLIESTGNTYLRIKAAQSLRKILPAEQACALFGSVAEREAGVNFLKFLNDMLEDLGCP